jgi:hypothetical protein
MQREQTKKKRYLKDTPGRKYISKKKLERRLFPQTRVGIFSGAFFFSLTKSAQCENSQSAALSSDLLTWLLSMPFGASAYSRYK